MPSKPTHKKPAHRAGQRSAVPHPKATPPPKAAPRRPAGAQTEANRTRATQLYLAGNPPPAIADQMHIPERTVRNHLQQTRKDFVEDHRAERDTMMIRAVESQRALAAAAFAAYEEERDRERAILAGRHDYVTRRIVRRGRPRRDRRPDDPDARDAASDDTGDGDGDGGELIEEVARPRLPNQSARFLALAFNAQREAAKLQGLYEPQARQADGPKHLLVADDVDPETGEPIIVPFEEKYPFDAPDDPEEADPADHGENLRGAQKPATDGNTPGAQVAAGRVHPATADNHADTGDGPAAPAPVSQSAPTPQNPRDIENPATDGNIAGNADPATTPQPPHNAASTAHSPRASP